MRNKLWPSDRQITLQDVLVVRIEAASLHEGKLTRKVLGIALPGRKANPPAVADGDEIRSIRLGLELQSNGNRRNGRGADGHLLTDCHELRQVDAERVSTGRHTSKREGAASIGQRRARPARGIHERHHDVRFGTFIAEE